MKKLSIGLFIIIIIMVLTTSFINLYMIMSTSKNITDIDKVEAGYDCVIVLGAGIRNEKPSPMLEDRLLTAIELYNKGIVPKILVSGDHEYKEHDEVNVMKNYLIDNGIPSSDIFMDHAGLSTYDSIYRAKEVFDVKKAIIVTQKYHLYRAGYTAKMMGIEYKGISAAKRRYMGQIKRDIREYFARIKDFIKCMIKPEPTYLGEVIPINGNGDDTND